MVCHAIKFANEEDFKSKKMKTIFFLRDHGAVAVCTEVAEDGTLGCAKTLRLTWL